MENEDNLAPKNVEETLKRIKDVLPNLPKRMHQCGEYVSRHHEQIAFSTVAEFAEKAQVQPSAMMRFCNLLGFKGYSEMQKLFRQDVIQAAPDYSTRLQNLRKRGDLTATKLLADFIEASQYSADKLMRDIKPDDLEYASEILANAPLIHIVGYRRAFPVSSSFSYTLEKLGLPSVLHDDIAKSSRYSSIRSGDALVAITFTPYTAGTVEVVQHALNIGANVIAITDTEISPVNIEGVCALKVLDIDVGDFRSLSTSINLAMALAVAAGSRISSRS